MKNSRINLTEGASEALSSMLKETKGHPGVRVGSSALASWIVSRYRENFFERDRARIEDAFLSSKDYLKGLLRASRSDEEAENELRKALNRMGKKKPGRGKNEGI